MRGRLIFQFIAEIYPLKAGGSFDVDPDFKEPVVTSLDNADPQRNEGLPFRLPCQVNSKSFEELNMTASGNSPKSHIELLFHFRDLEKKGLVDEKSGLALLKPGDRLQAIYDIRGHMVLTIKTTPGLFIVEARPIGFGLCRFHPKRNLLLVSFDSRATSTRRIR